MYLSKSELFLLEEVVKKNFSSKYKDSVLGILWSVLRPLLIMIMFTIVFSTIFNKTIENYAVYFLAGRCIFDLFSSSVATSLNAIRGNKNILTKTAAPKHIFVIGNIISEFLNFIISFCILLAVMVATHAHFYFSVMPFAIVTVASVLIMVTGLGLMLSIICVYYTDVQHLWGVVSLILMYSAAIFYPMDIVPMKYRQYMILSPVYWMTDQFRSIIYAGIIPDALYMINLLLISLIILVIGIIVFKKYESKVTTKF